MSAALRREYSRTSSQGERPGYFLSGRSRSFRPGHRLDVGGERPRQRHFFTIQIQSEMKTNEKEMMSLDDMTAHSLDRGRDLEL